MWWEFNWKPSGYRTGRARMVEVREGGVRGRCGKGIPSAEIRGEVKSGGCTIAHEVKNFQRLRESVKLDEGSVIDEVDEVVQKMGNRSCVGDNAG